MTEIDWGNLQQPAISACDWCLRGIEWNKYNNDKKRYEPASNYWRDLSHKEVYCSALCSLKMHESVKANRY